MPASRNGYLYILEVSHALRALPFFKIGITSRESPEARFKYSRYANFHIQVKDFVEGTMRPLWEKEKRIKEIIRSQTTKVTPFCQDYWHWTESFEDVDGTLNIVLDLMHA